MMKMKMKGTIAGKILFVVSLSLRYCTSFTSNDDWCPNVTCKDTGNCRPCDRKFLFILAQGRSGSTTVKNMINLLPGVRINGEIGDTIDKMHDLWSYISNQENLAVGSGNMKDAWGHNPYNSDFSCAAQKLIESLNPPENEGEVNNPSDIFGFKEIRVADVKTLQFLYTQFPCSRFVFNIRTESSALKISQYLHLKSEALLIKSHAIPRLYDILSKLLGKERVYLMDMVQWKDKDTGAKYFNDLARWLGFENCNFPRVLHDNDVKGWKWVPDDNRFVLDSSCRYAKGTAVS